MGTSGQTVSGYNNATSDIWFKLKAALKEKLNPHNYESWIEPIDFIELTDESLKLAAPSRFFVEWILEHYKENIILIFQELTGATTNLSFVIREKADQKKETGKTANGANGADVKSPPVSTIVSNLNEKYTFENFVVDKSNEFCRASCKVVADKIGRKHNPLFIYGGVGLGKTHLMQAIGNAALKKEPNLNVLYLSSEKFVNDLINSLQRGAMAAFRKKYRNLDILLVDDIQFLAGKDRTQEEFFHTFNTLFELKKQIVLSSDKFPNEIPNLEDRLRSRFASGLIADIQPPGLELKIAIVRKVAKENRFEINEEVAEYLSTKVRSNIRELEGCLSRVMAYASLMGRHVIEKEMVRDNLKGIYDDGARMVDIKQIQKAVSDFYNLKPADLKSKSRQKNIAMPRHVAVYLCREFTNASLPEIGRSFGGRDHTTVMHSVEKMKNEIEVNTQLYNEIKEIKKVLDL